jgi:cleavage and polyadenylation specificity factor subunit 2
MGLMFMYDAYLSKHYNVDNFTLFTPDHIDKSFTLMKQLKYSQHQVLDHKRGNFEIEVTPYNAGHMIGGCFWRLKCGMDEIIYVSHYNHTKERHLEAGILATLQRPMLLIAADCT